MTTPKLSFRLALLCLIFFFPWTASAAELAAPASDAIDAGPWIFGRALDADRRAVADARVELRALSPAGESLPTIHARADDRGRFSISAPAVGVYALTVSAPGRVPVVYAPLPVVENRRIPAAVLPTAELAEIETVRADGGPLAEPLVVEAVSSHLAPPLELHGWRPARRTVSVSSDGRATVPRLRGELLDLVLRRTDGVELDRRSGVTRASLAVPRALPAVAPATTEPRWPWKTVRGRVVSAEDGRPVPGALVWSRDEPGRFLRADAEGRFELAAPAPFRALAPGFLPADGEPAEGVLELSLERARAAFGRILDLDERPVADAQITVRAAEDHRAARSPFVHARTDADGRFELDALPASVVDLRARHPDFLDTVVRGIDAPYQSASVDLAAVDLGTLFLAPGAPLHGRVVDGAGRAVPEVKVWASADLQLPARFLLRRPPSDVPDAVTDAEGRFTITGAAAGDQRRLLLRADGFVPRTVGALAVGNDPDEPFEMVLRRGASIAGRVVDEEGAPIADASVSAEPVISFDQPSLPGPESHASTRTDENGAFRFSALPPRAYAVSVEATDFRPAEPRSLELAAETPAPELVFTLDRGAVLHGRVTNDRGEAVADARVLVARVAGRTDADGRYRIGGVDPGDWPARIVHPAYRAAERSVEIVDREEHRLDVELPAGHAVHGRTVDDEGLPVAGVDLIFELMHEDEPARRRATSDARGAFELADVPDGRFRVIARRDGFATAERSGIFEVEGEPLHDVEVVLEKGATVEGEILGLDFEQISTVRVRAEPESGPTLDGRVRHDGRFVIDDLGSGSWLLTAELPGAARQARARLRIEPGERRARRDLRFDGAELWAEIRLDGEPLADAEVTLEGRDVALSRDAITDSRGEVRVSDLPSGRYRLHVSYPRRWVSHSRELTLDGADRRLSVEIESLVLEGTVRSADDGAPVADAQLGLLLLAPAGEVPSEDPMSLFSVISGADGRFHVPRLSAGSYRLQVRRDGFADHEEELELRPGAPERTIEMRPTSGLDLRLVGGDPPPWVSARFVADDGRVITDVRTVELSAGGSEEGSAADTVRFPTLPAGRWSVLFTAPGRTVVERAVEIPGRAELRLPPAAGVRILVPELAEGDALAGVRLLAPDGRPTPMLSESTGAAYEHRVVAGSASLDGVAAGPWTIEVATADGRTWRGAFVAEPPREHRVRLE